MVRLGSDLPVPDVLDVLEEIRRPESRFRPPERRQRTGIAQAEEVHVVVVVVGNRGGSAADDRRHDCDWRR